MRIFIEEKETVVTIGSKISELSSSRDILDLESLRFAGVKIKDLNNLKSQIGASLVAQWLGIRLPMQGTRVRAPVREDPTCRGATRSVSHNY